MPPSRGYTIAGSLKLSYPQSRIMKMNFPEDPPIVNPAEQQLQQQLKKGEAVSVVGASSCRGHLIVEHKGQSYHVPFQYMELLRPSMPAGSVVVAGGGGSGGCGVTNNPNNATSIKNNNNSNNMANKNSSSTGNLTNNCNGNNNVGVNNGNNGNANNNNASNTSAAVKI